tara:strand:+ start:634 stop:1236 length:603 start_codon:yes stop_codon:yes gene_type:complete
MKRLLFIIIILIIIGYFQYTHINKISNSFEILQYENPKKNIFENMMQDKLISVFTNIQFENHDDIQKNLYYYNIPLTIDSNHQLLNEPINTISLIKRQDKYRHLFYIVKGTKRFFIFTPEQQKNLYLQNDISPINLWNQDTIKYPLIEVAKYIEVICRENTMISIPYNYYYTYVTDDEENITIDFYSESIFSRFLKKNTF